MDRWPGTGRNQAAGAEGEQGVEDGGVGAGAGRVEDDRVGTAVELGQGGFGLGLYEAHVGDALGVEFGVADGRAGFLDADHLAD